MMGFVTEKREEIMSLLQYAEWQLSRDVPDFEARRNYDFEVHLTENSIEKLKNSWAFVEDVTKRITFAGKKVVVDDKDYVAIVRKIGRRV